MKKILTLLLGFIFLSPVYSQDKTITYVYNKTSNAIEKVYKDGTKVVEKVYDAGVKVAPKIEKALESLGTSLKVGADKVWILLVRQQMVWSICFLLLTLASIANWIIWIRRALSKKGLVERPYTFKESKDRGYSYETNTEKSGMEFIDTNNSNLKWFIYVHLIICVVLSSLSFYHFTDMLTGFINPEFGAMKTIAEIASLIK